MNSDAFDNPSYDRYGIQAAMEALNAQRHQEEDEALKQHFDAKQGLEDAIAQKIYPALFSIEREDGAVGTGFFQHDLWLVSNAHVLPQREYLDAALIAGVGGQGDPYPVEVEASYHRPVGSTDENQSECPDIVIANLKARPDNAQHCLPTQFTGDEGYGSCFFYVDITTSEQPVVHDLECVSSGSYPFVYREGEGIAPQPGCSGTPIMEARVVGGHNPEWQFQVVGVLYARCSPAWVQEQFHVEEKGEQALVCAVPDTFDLREVLGILQSGTQAERYDQMQGAANVLGYAEQSAHHNQQAAAFTSEAESRLKRFETGASPLDVSLPNGLERLVYSRTIAITESMLIRSKLKAYCKAVGIPKKRIPHLENIVDSEEDLKGDYQGFMNKIHNEEDMQLGHGDRWRSSQLFGLDVKKTKREWQIQLQDNTGKDVKLRKKSASSVFATVKIPSSITSISGQALAGALKESQDRKKAVCLEAASSESQPNASQSKKKKDKTKKWQAKGKHS